VRARSRSSKEIEWIAKRTALVFAFFAAVAALVNLLGGPTWVVVALGAIAILAPIADWLIMGREHGAEIREEQEALLRELPVRVKELSATGGFYELGVAPEAPEALEGAGLGDREHAPYVERDIDELELRPALRTAAIKDAPSLIVVYGPSKSGKSRTLLEGAAVTVPDAWLIVPENATALGTLAGGKPPRQIGNERCVIWLDDIEPFVGPGDHGLSARTLRALEDWDRPVLVLGTAGGRGRELPGADAVSFAEPISDLLTAYPPIELASEQSVAEQARMSVEYSGDSIRRIARDGIGEYMTVVWRLIARLNERTCPEGVAIARAAIDWRRTGLQRPVRGECLRDLYRHHLTGPDTAGRFEQGLLWASAPLYSNVALLHGSDPYEPYDYLVDHARKHRTTVVASVWEAVIEEYATVDELASQVGVAAFEAGELDHAERAFRRADERGHAAGASNLGVVLQDRGDDAGAEAAYRRADERGEPAGASNLGMLLIRRGDDAGAEAALRRADERGNARGAYNLGVLLHDRGDDAGAEAAFRRADHRGDAVAASNLGMLLERRGDDAGAEAAYRRADERGDAAGASNLGVLLERRGDGAGGEAAYRRADQRGEPAGASNLGLLLIRRGDDAGAEAAFRRADERGDAAGAFNLGVLLERRGDGAGAEAAYRRADERGDAAAASNLGLLLQDRGDEAGAEAAYRRADERGDGAGAYNLGVLIQDRGDDAGAEAAYRRADERGNAAGTYNLGVLLADRGDEAGAEAALRRAAAASDEQAADAATAALEELRQRRPT
jgi:Flp pilus assembly protein TadD